MEAALTQRGMNTREAYHSAAIRHDGMPESRDVGAQIAPRCLTRGVQVQILQAASAGVWDTPATAGTRPAHSYTSVNGSRGFVLIKCGAARGGVTRQIDAKLNSVRFGTSILSRYQQAHSVGETPIAWRLQVIGFVSSRGGVEGHAVSVWKVETP